MSNETQANEAILIETDGFVADGHYDGLSVVGSMGCAFVQKLRRLGHQPTVLSCGHWAEDGTAVFNPSIREVIASLPVDHPARSHWGV